MPPAWIHSAPDSWPREGCTWLRYEPEPECFFKGEDPWRWFIQTPGLEDVQLGWLPDLPHLADRDRGLARRLDSDATHGTSTSTGMPGLR